MNPEIKQCSCGTYYKCDECPDCHPLVTPAERIRSLESQLASVTAERDAVASEYCALKTRLGAWCVACGWKVIFPEVNKAESAAALIEHRKHCEKDPMRYVEQENATLRAEVERLHDRLEDNRTFDTQGNRVPCEPGTIPDGIECRDETIRVQQRELERLQADWRRMRDEMNGAYAAAKGWMDEVARLTAGDLAEGAVSRWHDRHPVLFVLIWCVMWVAILCFWGRCP